MSAREPAFSRLKQIPASVWALGVVSLLMDFSSEMIHALLPVYLVGALGASMAQVGLIEGVAEATASDRKSTRLNSSHIPLSRMPSSA